ncbi:hypothetical protein N7G274_001684 [Stereocaulon virgatum]|uniref:F-box domain-containing protein n=1 Tax=Stereocaulon virgatum TaxID=373712 RepID=A0ABR4AKD8_9LECA
MSGAFLSPKDSNSPVGSQTSPRSMPSGSLYGSSPHSPSPERADSNVCSSSQQSPIRGRTLTLNPSANREDSRSRASTSLQANAKLFGFEDTLAYQRLLSRDLTAEPDQIFDSIKEPLPPGIEWFRSSLSEELYKAATWESWDSSVDLTKFGEHRDTFAILGLRKLQDRRLTLPPAFWKGLLPHIDHETYLALRLSCRCWSAAISHALPVRLPSVSMFPAEILGNIFTRLDPIDFNAARHTCRSWMVASLEGKLLIDMLQRGGWGATVQADMEVQAAQGGDNSPESASTEWLLSRRLATECSLLPGWTGNGLSSKPLESSDGQYPSTTGLFLISETDFSEMSNGYSHMFDGSNGAALHFTVSVCNKFLLVTEGCIINVFSIRDDSSIPQKPGGHLSPVTIVVCPHRVLAVSMDTSSQRFAIAVLLEGRVGMVCDLHEHAQASHRSAAPRALSMALRDLRPSVYSPHSSAEHIMTEPTSSRVYGMATDGVTYHNVVDRAMARAIAEATLPEVHGARPFHGSWTMDDPLLMPVSPASEPIPTIPNARYVPIETGPRSIYRNLCSAEDPPRSVALCPQRRCVAFGCSGGIELHWVDTLTGQDLNRWFPLTAPSDFLYFLPPRPGVDSTKKLRLISSACHPKERDGLQSRFLSGYDKARHYGISWENEGFNDPGGWDHTWRGSAFCDHYQAVPVSDGWNVLFTDPEDGCLCLGSDAPPGAGASKLVRRYIFIGPNDEQGKPIVPKIYKSGGELRWGGRVVAGYGDGLWLFVVPPDGFRRNDNKGEGEPRFEPSETAEWFPKRISGVQFATVPGLVDIAIDATSGDLTVWAPSINGVAYVWQLGGGSKSIIKRIIQRDGTVSLAQDADGDTVMHCASASNSTASRGVQFDGSASGTMSIRPMPLPLYGANDHIIDQDGDTAMPDAPDYDEDEGYVSGNDEFEQAGGVFAIHAPPLWGRWSEESADWVPDYLAAHGKEIEDEGLGVDLLKMVRCEVVVRGL